MLCKTIALIGFIRLLLFIYDMARLMRLPLEMMDWLAVNRGRFGILEFLDLFLRELRAIHLDGQPVKLSGQRERRLIILIIHASQRVGTDIEALVPLQNHRQGVRHRDGLDFLAIHLERAGARTAEAAHVIERKCAQAQAVILEIKLDGMLAGRERVWSFPLDAFQVNHVPQEHWLAFEQVEAIATEPSTGGKDHTLDAAFLHFDVGSNGVRAVEQER